MVWSAKRLQVRRVEERATHPDRGDVVDVGRRGVSSFGEALAAPRFGPQQSEPDDPPAFRVVDAPAGFAVLSTGPPLRASRLRAVRARRPGHV
jgi:hypothetical protein